MKDLRIVIVSWNVREELERCLRSLPKACEGLMYDVVVVDNASEDGTREWLPSAVDPQPSTAILNEENRGFAKACNQGIAGYDARYVLLLNPDTECPAGSLTAFVHEADIHPKAGICGPKILNEDGSVQPSVRRFPDIWSQLVVLLKLTHISKWFSRFLRKYHADDLDVDRIQDVDQVMGACFLIRRELIEKIGGLDEAYEIWFEEVDYCKQAYAHGYTVMYLPQIHVNHLRGASFAKADAMRKQRIFTASMQTYFQKWHPGWRATLIRTCRPFALWLTKTMLVRRGLTPSEESSRNSYLPSTTYHLPTWFLLILSLELISALTIFHWAWNSIALIAIAGLFAWVAYKRPALALSALFLELIIGSKGALLQLGGWPGILSLRVVLFVALFLGWGLNVLVHHRVPQVIRLLGSRKAWMFLVAMAGYGALRGLAFHHEQAGADANAWVFLALLAPVLDIADRDGKRLKQYAFGAFIAGIAWLGIKTIGLEYLFSHGFKSISPEAYLWVRRTGVGEVTLVTANAFRIFMQSYIWLIPALFGVVSYVISHQKDSRPNKTNRFVFLSLILATLGISLSRSIWIGCAVGGLLLIVLYRERFFQAWKSLIGFVVSGIAAFVIIFVTLAFPIPHVDMASMKTLFGSRASTSDAAAASRWNLLPPVMEKIKQHPILGNGFGATITYESKDPRILQDHPDGMYTTYAFEWGWLEHWVKMGIFGFLAVMIVLFSLIRRVATSQLPEWTRYAALATIAALAAVHVFTPYLNHPLGLGILFMIEGILVLSSKNKFYGQEI